MECRVKACSVCYQTAGAPGAPEPSHVPLHEGQVTARRSLRTMHHVPVTQLICPALTRQLFCYACCSV